MKIATDFKKAIINLLEERRLKNNIKKKMTRSIVWLYINKIDKKGTLHQHSMIKKK